MHSSGTIHFCFPDQPESQGMRDMGLMRKQLATHREDHGDRLEPPRDASSSISVCELCNCAPVFAFQSQFVVAVPKPDKVIVQATKQETFF